MPLATIVMPLRNAEPYVAAALASVLAETAADLEVVVVDDGSSDGSRARVDAVADRRLRVIDGPRRGIAACMNAGLEAARGDIVLRCDADDLYPPGRIRRQVEWLGSHPGHIAVCGSFSTLDPRGQVVADLMPECGTEPADIREEMLGGRTRTTLCAFALRAEAARAVGGFREFFETASDLDFQLRLAEQGQIRYLPENTYFYRLHGESITHSQHRERRLFFEATARAFCRQRRDSGRDDLDRGTPPVPPEPPRQAESPPGAAGEHIQGMLLGEAWRQHALGHRRRAALLGYRALLARPLSLGAWKSCAALLLK
jgi:glycosyltransferase involved in cell wall biosynthesis